MKLSTYALARNKTPKYIGQVYLLCSIIHKVVVAQSWTNLESFGQLECQTDAGRLTEFTN